MSARGIVSVGEALRMRLAEDIDYEKLRDGKLVLKLIRQGEADVEAGRTVSHEEVFAEIRERLAQ